MKNVKSFLYRLLFNDTKRDSLITFTAFFLMMIGLLFSTSAAMSSSTTVYSTFMSFVKQLVFITAGVIAYFAVSNVFTVPLCRKYIRFLAFSEVCLLLTAVIYCRIFGAVNGNYSWIGLPFGMSIQPSEFAKVITILLIACLIADKKFNHFPNIWACVKVPVQYIGLFIGIIVLLQKDMGSAIICLFCGCIVYLIPNNKKLHSTQMLLCIMAVCGVAFVIFCLTTQTGQDILAKISTTFAARFRAVTNPSYSDDNTREIFYSLLGISKGSLFGVGLGNSVQKFGYLVSSDADYVFAVIVEETGIIGIALVFIPYMVLIYRLVYYCNKVTKESDKVILVGTISYLFLHFFLNIGGVSGFIPLTGVPLLFLSRGGSALLSVMVMLGISQAVISEYYHEKEAKRLESII